MRTQIKLLLEATPSIPIYFYLLLLAIGSSSAFIFLLHIIV